MYFGYEASFFAIGAAVILSGAAFLSATRRGPGVALAAA
jgi:hypothetical protein